MDARHFDALVSRLAQVSSRRQLLVVLATLPLFGEVFGILTLDEAHAKDRRRRRKQRHKRHKDPGKKRRRKHKNCRPDAITTTCAGKCGSVTNNCKQIVNCGSCTCSPACAECFTCQETTGVPGACVAEASGTPCGAATFCSDGTVFPQGSCDGAGTCISSLEVSCDPYAQCDGDACATSCGTTTDCVDGFYCDGTFQCVPEGAPGDPCTDGAQCSTGFCVDDVCCATASCPACQTCAGGTCTADPGQDRRCCAGADGEQWCQAGACVPIPSDARATLEECTGRCDCVPYSGGGCFGGTPAYQEICGATRLCPLCEQCKALVSGCDGASAGEGPAGLSYYCIFSETVGSCLSMGTCPNPETEVCLGGRYCSNICGLATS